MAGPRKLKPDWLPAQYSKWDRNDYCKLESEANVGLCEIRGRRNEQEDSIAFSEEIVAYFQTLSDEEKQQAFIKTFQDLQAKHKEDLFVGSTACVTITWQDPNNRTLHAWNANLGDSLAYIAIVDEKTGKTTLERLNKLHVPNPGENKDEAERLRQGNYKILTEVDKGKKYWYLAFNKYKLSVTRAVGDVIASKHGLSHEPEITHREIDVSPHHKVLLLSACDGLTETNLSENKIAQVIKTNLKLPYDKIAAKLVTAAFDSGSMDNISVAISEPPASIAIFDGHGGRRVSRKLEERFYPVLKKNILEPQLEHALKQHDWLTVIPLLLSIDSTTLSYLKPSILTDLNSSRSSATAGFINYVKRIKSPNEQKKILDSIYDSKNSLGIILNTPTKPFAFNFTLRWHNFQRITKSISTILEAFPDIQEKVNIELTTRRRRK